tara:strand:+ start:34310 stop:35236 length:927 start_codon:yes stop_codon:yes gene_type:complete
MSQNRFLAQVGLVLTTLAWGATFVLVKDSLEYAKPFTFIFFRFIIATLAILPFIFLNKKRNFFNRINNSEIGFGLICGLLLFIGYAFQNFGLEITIPSKSAFITSISVLIVPIILVFYKNEITTPRLWISILIVIFGLYLLIDPGSGVEQSNEKYGKDAFLPNLGDVLTFGCAIFFAMHIIAQSDAVKNKINLIRFFIIQCLSVSLFAGLCALIINEPAIPWEHPQINILYWSLIINGMIATTFAIFVMIWAQKILSAGETAVIFSLEPIFAALFSIFMGVESFGVLQWTGGIIVVLSVIYYSKSSIK